MREAKTKVITGADGRAQTYVVMQMSTTPALRLLVDVVKAGGKGLPTLLANLGSIGKLLDAEVGGDWIGKAIGDILENIDFEKLDAIIKPLARHTTVDGAPLEGIYEAHFAAAGLGVALFQWLPFALKAQYADFPNALRSVIGSPQSPSAVGKAAA